MKDKKVDTKNYYIYIWYRLDLNIPFYVGKGIGYRYKELRNRNKYFLNIVKSKDTQIKFLHEGLTNEEACKLETEIIKNFRDLGYNLCNYTNGGDGGDTFKYLSPKEKIDVKKRISLTLKETFKDPNIRIKLGAKKEKNGMYGKGYKLKGDKNGRAITLILIYPNGVKEKVSTFLEAEKSMCKFFNVERTKTALGILKMTEKEGCYTARAHAKNKYMYLNGMQIYYYDVYVLKETDIIIK